MKKSLFVLFFASCALSLFSEEKGLSFEQQKKLDYFYLEGLRLKANGEKSNAYHAFQHALKVDSTSSATLFELSNYYLSLRAYYQALESLEKATLYSPENLQYKLALANLNRDLGKSEEAIALYETIVKENPNKHELHYYLSQLYLREGQIEKSIQSLDAMEDNMGMEESLSLQKYSLYNHINQGDKALKEIEKLAEKFPTVAKYPIIIGDFYLSHNQKEKALKQYEKAYKLDPLNPYYVVSMANYYELMGDEEAVTKEIEKALKNPLLEMDIKLEILGKYIEELLQEKKDIEKANSLLKTLLEQHPQEKELQLIYGEFLLSQSKIEDAKFQFKLVTESNPDEIKAWHRLLNIAIDENNTSEIISTCEAASVYFPEVAEFYFYKGAAYMQEEKYEQALETYQKSLTITSPNEDPILLSHIYGQIGDIYFYQNDKEKAYQAFDKAVGYDENNITVMNNYAYFLALDKRDLAKAERMSGKCIQLQPNNATFIDTYAWIFFQQGNYSLAKFYIESALSNGGDANGEIIEHHGDILFKTGDVDSAVTEWKKALNIKLILNENTELLEKKIANRNYYDE